ncbi:unnamed protein product [Brugia timori]|uniref:Secreted protein n=1 Tax=Brugia timori TaxID=42155 RepID=A0A0R3QSR2_9BILA|nr:unnamed protein product [Brugia timori]
MLVPMLLLFQLLHRQLRRKIHDRNDDHHLAIYTRNNSDLFRPDRLSVSGLFHARQ